MELEVTSIVKQAHYGTGKWFDKEVRAWKKFYPIKDLCIDDEVFDERQLSEMEDKVYGKYASGTSGYNVVWTYLMVDKSKLRAIIPKPKL
jgi:hypothetical protein